jgi:hypothetical protein
MGNAYDQCPKSMRTLKTFVADSTGLIAISMARAQMRLALSAICKCRTQMVSSIAMYPDSITSDRYGMH